MPDYRQSVRDYILATRRVLELGDLSSEEGEALRETIERLSAVLAHHPAE